MNEVGHDRKLVQNVIAREVDDRIVHYYVYQQQPMSKGETVELLVDYGKQYEGTRIRKGYGKQNIEGWLESDRDDEFKFKRDHADRASIKMMIQSMSMVEIQKTLIFLEAQIIEPLVHYTDAYFMAVIKRARNPINSRISSMREPTKRQLRARQRLIFVGDLFRRRLDGLVQPHKRTEAINNMYTYINEKRLNPFVAFDRDSGYLQREEDLWNIYISERFAEITLQISNGYDLFHSYEPSIWCAVARDLCEKLVKLVTAQVGTIRNPRAQVNKMFMMAKDAANTIMNAHHNLSSSTSSPQTILESCRLLGFVQTNNEIIDSHLKCNISSGENQCFPYVQLIPTGHYVGSAKNSLTGLSSALESFCTTISPEKGKSNNRQFVLRCNSKDTLTHTMYSAQLVTDGLIRIDYQWYLLWQVVRVVDVFQKHFPQDNYDLKRLCKDINVDHNLAEWIISIEMKEPFESTYTHYDDNMDGNTFDSEIDKNDVQTFFAKPIKPTKQTVSYKNKAEKMKNPKLPLYSELDGTLPKGWKLEEVTRKNNSRHVDRYWYTGSGKRFRSRVEVFEFLNLLGRYNGDEESAWLAFQSQRKKKKCR